MLKIGWKTCPYCDDEEVYRSRSEPRTWLDRACGLFFLQLVRCRRCEIRHYRPIFFPAPHYPHPVSGLKRSMTAASNENNEQRKRSA